jgi:biotin carboxylase
MDDGDSIMNDLKGKRLLVLGGSRISCEIVNKAKEMGIFTVVTDWYPLEDSPAKKIADKAFMTSTSDVTAILKLIKDEKIEGILTGFTDSTLPYYSQICKESELPCYATEEQFKILTNKKIYKRLCRDFGVPVVDEYNIADFKENNTNGSRFPLLVKPADNSGGRGITVCNNQQDLFRAYEKALNYSESKEVLIERYIEGKEVTVFFLLQDGEIFLTAMGDRHTKHNHEDVIALPVAYTFPSVHLAKYQQMIEPNVKKMFESIGLKDGMVFMQCLVESGECVVYDIGYRLTGSLEYKLIEKVCEYNPLEMMIRYALTGKMSENFNIEKVQPNWDKYACNVSFLVKPGIIGKINGIEEILNIPGVVDVVLNHIEGEEIPESAKGTLQQIIIRVLATASSQSHLKELLDKIYGSLKVISVDGKDMLLDGFNSDELGSVLI